MTGSIIGLLLRGGRHNTTGHAMVSIKTSTCALPCPIRGWAQAATTYAQICFPPATTTPRSNGWRTWVSTSLVRARSTLSGSRSARDGRRRRGMSSATVSTILVPNGPPTGKCHRMTTLTFTVSAGSGPFSPCRLPPPWRDEEDGESPVKKTAS
jgi:hypothetical protein